MQRCAVAFKTVLMQQMPGCPAALAVAQLANKIESTLLKPAGQ